MSRQQLRMRVQQLIGETNWAQDKQELWLAARGIASWNEASNEELQAAIDYLEQFAKMFDTSLDSVPRRPNNHTRAETQDALRVYYGEHEEE